MACKHRRIMGDTTKYFVCRIKNESVDDMQCSKCMLRIEDASRNVAKSIFGEALIEEIFGKGFGGK